MRRSAIGTATFGILAAATLGLAGTASATPLEDESAADAINQLKRRDIACSSTYQRISLRPAVGMSGPRSPWVVGHRLGGQALTPAQAGTVYVDVNCPEDVS
jgi:hypothetical protein